MEDLDAYWTMLFGLCLLVPCAQLCNLQAMLLEPQIGFWLFRFHEEGCFGNGISGLLQQ